MSAAADGRGTRHAWAASRRRSSRYAGSMFELRARVEPLVAGDDPSRSSSTCPGVTRDRDGSVLMELEKAGDCYEPQLKRLARNSCASATPTA